MVDERQIAFRPAVEISYLTEEQQYTLLEAMEYNDATPSLAQAIKMKKYNQDGKLTSEVIQSIMEEEKPNQKEKPAFRRREDNQAHSQDCSQRAGNGFCCQGVRVL